MEIFAPLTSDGALFLIACAGLGATFLAIVKDTQTRRRGPRAGVA
ncbi:MAG TPA: hypothetical protein VJP45_01355 [Candidatus Limnocylindria bacterium]|nr:hypothetical protein [Candidatus Limnocylindria bacterium]